MTNIDTELVTKATLEHFGDYFLECVISQMCDLNLRFFLISLCDSVCCFEESNCQTWFLRGHRVMCPHLASLTTAESHLCLVNRLSQ